MLDTHPLYTRVWEVPGDIKRLPKEVFLRPEPIPRPLCTAGVYIAKATASCLKQAAVQLLRLQPVLKYSNVP